MPPLIQATRRDSRRLPAICVAIALGAAFVCAAAAAETAKALRYQLSWQARKPQDGPALLLGNNLGYRIRLNRAYLTNRNLELIPCQAPTPFSGLDMLQWLLSPSVAYAGHSATPDPSSTKGAY